MDSDVWCVTLSVSYQLRWQRLHIITAVLQVGHGSSGWDWEKQNIMRLILLLAGLLILTQAQRSHWRRRGGRGGRLRGRRYSQSEDRGRSSLRRRYERQRGDSYEGDHLKLSSTELARRVYKFERSERRYYPDNNNNYHHQQHYRQNSSQVLEATPEYRVQTRGGDTIIEFARSGESQGELSFPHCEIF